MHTTPTQLLEAIQKISDESYELHMELATLAIMGGDAKLELMRFCKSSKEIELRWSATPEGAREAYLKVYLKGLSHKRTALILEARANSNNY